MAQSYTTLRDFIEASLRDSTNTYFKTPELDNDIAQALREIARYKKHLVRVTYQVESRIGEATSTSTDNLVDATNDQFVAGDVGKRVYNKTDETWADITSYSDAETVGLSHDIMADGESYQIFNKGCFKNNQVNIEDVEDKLWVERVEFPLGKRRNFTLHGDILEIAIDFTPEDSADTGSKIDVYVWFAKRHKVSQLTDFAGAVNNGSNYSKGDTSMILDALESSGTIEEDQEFTLANRSQVYTVTASATISSNAATIYFYPGLDGDVLDNAVVNFVASTVPRRLEMLLVEYVVGRALMNEANLHLASISAGGTGTYKRYLESASFRYTEAMKQLRSLAEPDSARILPKSNYMETDVDEE